MRRYQRSFTLVLSVYGSCLLMEACGSSPSTQPSSARISRKAPASAAAAVDLEFSEDNSADVYQPTWSDASGNDGKGGIKLISAVKDKRLLLRRAGFSLLAGDKTATSAPPEWNLFSGPEGKSLALEWIWVTQGSQKHWDKLWAGAGVAFNLSWSTVNAIQAQSVVLWARTSHPQEALDLNLGLHSTSKAKGAEDTGTVSLLKYLEGGRLEAGFRRAVIPLSAFPNIEQVDLSALQTLLVNVSGTSPENQRVGVYLDGIRLTAAAMAASVETPGYLLDDRELILFWSHRPESPDLDLLVRDGKQEIARANVRDDQVRIDLGRLGKNQRISLEIVAVGAAQNSRGLRVEVNLQQPPTEDVTVIVESQPRHLISKYILGTNNASPAVIRAAGLTINRWGGNATSRYNWQGDLSSSGADWFFLNHYTKPVGTPEEQKDYYTKIAYTLQAGADVNFTIPMLPWIAKPSQVPDERYCGYPVSQYPQQERVGSEGCGNGILPNGEKIWGNDPNLTSIPNSPTFQRGFVQSITRLFGGAKDRGVRFYSLDNEPGLWFDTHRDVMPTGVSTATLATLSEAYAGMIKAVDPDAQVIGFAAWGVMELAASNLDYTPPGPNGYRHYNDFKGQEAARNQERKQNGDQPQLVTLLRRFAELEKKHKKRLIDVIDIHWYPELYAQDSKGDRYRLANDMPYDPVLFEKHLESTREWYDPAFVPDGKKLTSWTVEPALKGTLWDPWHPVIPALKRIIEENYPGTKLAINEFTTGAEKLYHGAVVRALTYGIFMQEDLYMAANWSQVEANTFTYQVQKLFGNYDGRGSRVQGHFLRSTSSSKDLVSFAAKDGPRQTVLFVNRSLTRAIRVKVAQPAGAERATRYLVTESAGTRLVALPTPITRGKAGVLIPPLSVTLLVQQ